MESTGHPLSQPEAARSIAVYSHGHDHEHHHLHLAPGDPLYFEISSGFGASVANGIVVSDGKALTLVDYEVNQVQRWPISNSPLGALLDPRRDVKRYGKLVSTGNPDVLSIEVKDPKKPEYGVITLVMVKDPSAPGGLELASWVQLDSQNQRTTVRLTNQRYGVSVADSAFRFQDPRRSSRRPG
mgnify:CR=1 FL=1